MKKIPLIAAALLTLSAPVCALRGEFREILSPHFQVGYQRAFAPAGIVMDLERIHNRLRMDLAMFAPWMARERVKIRIYASQKAYLGAEFRPPTWSNGIALRDERLVAVYEQKDPSEALGILTHELTHLFFESYWGAKTTPPPSWINEGLALLEETRSSEKERSRWESALPRLRESSWPLEKFFAIVPAQDLRRQGQAEIWYLQAYSLISFLYQGHSRLQFFNFCGQLRDGRSLEQALWTVYRYSSVQALDDQWRSRMRLPAASSFAGKGSSQTKPGRLKLFGKSSFQSFWK
ncbi:MAG: hypothetical protein WCU88_11960 [Elusimicrobiota bacterium]